VEEWQSSDADAFGDHYHGAGGEVINGVIEVLPARLPLAAAMVDRYTE